MIVGRFFKIGLVLIVLMMAGRVMGAGGARGDGVRNGVADGVRDGVRDRVAGKDIEVRSPDGGIRFVFRVDDGLPEYGISYKGVVIMEWSPLSLMVEGSGLFGKGLVAGKGVLTVGEDNYTLVVGKTKLVHDQYVQAVIPLEEKERLRRKINFIVRVFNDGVAFRYEVPAQAGWTSYSLLDEGSTFRVVGDPIVMATFREGFTT